MPDEDKKSESDPKAEEALPRSSRHAGPDAPRMLPAIHRYHPFTDLGDRMTTKALNRVVMVGIGAAVAIDILKPIWSGMYESAYCYECRACYATQEMCPAAITYQAELVIACRTSDYRRFIENKGLLCYRCGNCNGFCVQHLDLAHMFGKMGNETVRAMERGKIPFGIVENAIFEGWVGKPYIDRVYAWYRSKGGRRLERQNP
jgi:ferredoxin